MEPYHKFPIWFQVFTSTENSPILNERKMPSVHHSHNNSYHAAS